MTPIMALRHLRALREKRAVHALSVAKARLTAACKLESDLGKTLDRHDRISAEEDAGLHDQMIARGFTRSDLLAAEDRNRSNAARRDPDQPELYDGTNRQARPASGCGRPYAGSAPCGHGP